jgi:MOSC domain-containing protein YiiM
MRAMGRVTALYVYERAGAAATALAEVHARPGGLVEDRPRGRRRQVTVVAIEDWRAATAEVGAAGIDVARRKANVVVEGVRLAGLVGRRLRLGDAVLEVLGETDPCPKMNRVAPGLEDAMRPGMRGGVFGAVVVAGRIRVGDAVAEVRAEVAAQANGG